VGGRVVDVQSNYQDVGADFPVSSVTSHPNLATKSICR
jgi:hypothetical protein